MKRVLSLLLVSLLMVSSLAACGCTAKQAGNEDQVGTNGQNGNAMTDGTNNGTNQGTLTDDNSANNGTVTGDLENDGEDMINGAENVGEAVKDGVEEAGDALTGHNNGTTGGVTYEQMLRNGRVSDTDGNLTTRENAAATTSAR